MTKVTEDTIEGLTKLCHIACSEEDKKRLLVDIEQVLSHAQNLTQLPTDAVEECHNVSGIVNREREDETQPSLPRERLLENAPEHEDGQLSVPPLFRKK